MLDAGRLDLKRSDPVARRDDYVVASPGVPHIAVLVHHGGVLAVEPLAVERLTCRLLVPPVTERVVGVRARAEADLPPLTAGHLFFILVEDADVPAGPGPSHRALAHLHPWVSRDQRVRLRQAVVVEDGDVVLPAEPAEGLRVERLSGRADAAKC